MHSRNLLEMEYLERGLSTILSKFNFIFFRLLSKFRYFFNFVVHHLTFFDALIERGFEVFPKVTIGN